MVMQNAFLTLQFKRAAPFIQLFGLVTFVDVGRGGGDGRKVQERWRDRVSEKPNDQTSCTDRFLGERIVTETERRRAA